MTGRIGGETKFDTAVHASLALMSACARAGDNAGLMVFGRRVNKFLPPKRGIEHMDGVLEALYDLEPELIEPSYARAFQYISSNVKKRSFVVILTDVVDKESSKELITSLKLLRPRHLQNPRPHPGISVRRVANGRWPTRPGHRRRRLVRGMSPPPRSYPGRLPGRPAARAALKIVSRARPDPVGIR